MVGVKTDDQSVTLYVAKLRQAFADQGVFTERAETRKATPLKVPAHHTASPHPNPNPNPDPHPKLVKHPDPEPNPER